MESSIIINEGQHLRLRCAATGFPQPHIEWRREDNRTINVGAWQGKHFLILFYFKMYANFKKGTRELPKYYTLNLVNV